MPPDDRSRVGARDGAGFIPRRTGSDGMDAEVLAAGRWHRGDATRGTGGFSAPTAAHPQAAPGPSSGARPRAGSRAPVVPAATRPERAGLPLPSAAASPSARTPAIWIAVGVVALLVVGAGAWFVFGGAASAQAAQVQLEATSTAGPSPFTAPVGEDATGVVAPANARAPSPATPAGSTPRTPRRPACDTPRWSTSSARTRPRRRRGASRSGSTADSIGGFVGTLAAVTLRADTNVTEYGYGGRAVPALPGGAAGRHGGAGQQLRRADGQVLQRRPAGPAHRLERLGHATSASPGTACQERTIIVTPAPAPITQSWSSTRAPTPSAEAHAAEPEPEAEPGAADRVGRPAAADRDAQLRRHGDALRRPHPRRRRQGPPGQGRRHPPGRQQDARGRRGPGAQRTRLQQGRHRASAHQDPVQRRHDHDQPGRNDHSRAARASTSLELRRHGHASRRAPPARRR